MAAFSALYGLHGVLCSPRWDEAALGLAAGRGVLGLAGLLAVAAQVALLLALRSGRFASPSGFVRATSVGLSVVALVATLWTLIPVAATSTCL
nr:hypothetical protein [Rubellimicrobium arenae]